MYVQRTWAAQSERAAEPRRLHSATNSEWPKIVKYEIVISNNIANQGGSMQI